MRHIYEDVPGLGTVELSRHAQARAEALGVNEAQVEQILNEGGRVEEGFDIVICEGLGTRIVVLLNPKPDFGKKLAKTIYRINPVKKINSSSKP